MNNINTGSSSFSLSLSNQTSNSSNNSILEYDENPKRQKIDHETQALIPVMKSKQNLFDISINKLIMGRPVNHIFKNFVSFDTNGFDRICLQGPPFNILWIYEKFYKPHCLACFPQPKNGEENKHFFVHAKMDPEKPVVWLVDAKAHQIFRLDFHKKILTDTFGTAYTSGLSDGISPLFNSPAGLAVLKNGNVLLCDFGNKCIRTIDPSSKLVTTLETKENDKPFTFTGPSFLVVNKDNSYAYVTDITKIVSVQLKTGQCTILAGSDVFGGYIDDIGSQARFQHLCGIALDTKNNNLYIVDNGNKAVRSLDISNGMVQTINLYHSNIEKKNVQLEDPLAIQIDPLNGGLCVVDRNNELLTAYNRFTNGRLEFKRFTVAVAIRAIGYTRGILKQNNLYKKALHKLIMRTFVSCLSPAQFEQVYNLGINLINIPDKREVIKDLLLTNVRSTFLCRQVIACPNDR